MRADHAGSGERTSSMSQQSLRSSPLPLCVRLSQRRILARKLDPQSSPPATHPFHHLSHFPTPLPPSHITLPKIRHGAGLTQLPTPPLRRRRRRGRRAGLTPLLRSLLAALLCRRRGWRRVVPVDLRRRAGAAAAHGEVAAYWYGGAFAKR